MFSSDGLNIGGEHVSVYAFGYFSALKAALSNAVERVWLTSYVWNMNPKRKSDPMLKVISYLEDLAFRRNGDVRIALHLPRRGSTNRHCNMVFGRMLLDKGFDVRAQNSRSSLHAKAIVVDRTHLFIGSHNLVRSSLFNPLELSVCVGDYRVVDQFAKYFDTWWRGLKPYG